MRKPDCGFFKDIRPRSNHFAKYARNIPEMTKTSD